MYKYVVFDLDGTLIDTSEGTVKMFQATLKHAGINVTDDFARSLIGPPLTRTLVNKYGLSEEKAREAIDCGDKYMKEKGAYECKTFDGMIEVLDTLKSNGIIMAVATSQPKWSADIETTHVKIKDYFYSFEANNHYQTRGSKTDFIGMCLDDMGVTDKSEVVMIGDKKPDIQGGKDNGIDTIGVLYGYGDLEEIENENPDYIVSNPYEILDIIFK